MTIAKVRSTRGASISCSAFIVAVEFQACTSRPRFETSYDWFVINHHGLTGVTTVHLP